MSKSYDEYIKRCVDVQEETLNPIRPTETFTAADGTLLGVFVLGDGNARAVFDLSRPVTDEGAAEVLAMLRAMHTHRRHETRGVETTQ